MKNTSLLRRLGAMLYDTLLVLGLLFGASGVWLFLSRMISGNDTVEPGTLVYQLYLLLVLYGFFVGFWFRHGRTLGMQAWRLHLESNDGRKPTLTQCSVRFAVSIVSLLAFGLGFLWQLVDRDRLTWHDRASGTRLRWFPKDEETASTS